MIEDIDKKIIQEISRKYNVKRVLLFCSSLDPNRESHDIDLAVDGIIDKDFFKFHGDLLLKLSKPVDLIDLFVPSKFTSIIEQEGVCIYG